MQLTRKDEIMEGANLVPRIKEERDAFDVDTHQNSSIDTILHERTQIIDESHDVVITPLIEKESSISTIKQDRISEDIVKNRYDTLSSIFPHISHEYILRICSNPSLDETNGNVLELLTEHLLTHQIEVEGNCDKTSRNVQSNANMHSEMNNTSDNVVENQLIMDQSNTVSIIKKETASEGNHSVDSHMNDIADEETQMEERDNNEIFNTIEEESDLNPPIKEEKVDENDMINHRYTTLLSIFPDIDHDYLKRISSRPPFESLEGNVLSMLIDHLLTYKNETAIRFSRHSTANDVEMSDVEDATLVGPATDLQIANDTVNDQLLSEILFEEELAEKEREKSLNEKLLSEFLQKEHQIVNGKLKILVNILPDACPETLRKFVEQNRESSDSLQQLVDSFLDNRNYEKRDQYFAKLKIQKSIEQCITQFDVEEFLRKFPEPFEYFEDSSRSTAYSDQAVNFLHNKYKYYNIDYIKDVYTSNKHNLTLTDRDLRRENVPDTLAHSDLNQIDDASLLQEIAFIQNRTLLKEYFDAVEEAEKNELEILRVQELLLECQCCFDECKPLDTIECENCHVFCKKCVIRGTKFATSNQQSSIKCFAGCDTEIPLRVLQKILPVHIFDAFFKKRQEQEVMDADLEGLENCPHCLYSMELAPEIKIFTCNNPECMKITCRMCKKPNHLPIKCEDVLDEDKARVKIEEAMSNALIRRCYRCQRPFVKSVGCNTMTCVCGAQMCYICQQPFGARYNHRGCVKESKAYEQQQVELNRRQTTAQIRQDFPDLNIPKI